MRSIVPLLAIVSLAAAPALARDRFLADGGGIRTERVVGTPFGPAVLEMPALGEGRPFLEDGGGIRFAPELPRLPQGGSYGGRRASDHGSSITEVPNDRRGGAFGRNVSVVVINGNGVANGAGEAPEPSAPGYGGAKIIRVATARLDHRPYDASGLDIVRSGATKIIRIAPPAGKPMREEPRDETLELENGENLATLAPREPPMPAPTKPPRNETAPRNEAAPAAPVAPPVPEPRPEPQSAAAAGSSGFEPWTADWLRDCVSRYPTFDASLGTYTDETGRRRFCTGEP
ncbi:BA14K family protein [Aureimonas sp. AU4]|uniref:BA14K family protein n=1 Tax=Aureimonas sp. AU4 TaxID=1638163 RepID=UPI0007820402|nr:BA14K family protein [Aureimonas sp. AU4]